MQNPSGRMTDADRSAEQAFAAYYNTAELYYAYHLIYITANQPFKTVDDSTLFNAARWVSRAFILWPHSVVSHTVSGRFSQCGSIIPGVKGCQQLAIQSWSISCRVGVQAL